MAPVPSTLATAPPRRGRLFTWFVDSDVGAVLVAAVFTIAAGLVVIREPSYIQSVTIANPTDYELFVSVGSSTDRSLMPVVVILPRETREVRDVVDQGPGWVFDLRSQGHEAGRVPVSRADLVASGWKVTLPASLGDALKAQGVNPSR